MTNNELRDFYINKSIIKMSNKAKDIDIRNQTYYFFNDMINIKSFEMILNQMKIHTKIFLFTILDM